MAKRLVLRGGDVIQPEGVLSKGVVVIEDGLISGIYHMTEFSPFETDSVFDCSGMFICPGFIDLHNQGGNGYTVMDGSMEHICGIARAHTAHGTTGLLLTPSIEKDTYRSLLPKLADAVGMDTGGASILGIHSEGPFVNPERRGCMPLSAIFEPDAAVLDEILELGKGKIVEMTIAPELPGALDMILKLNREGIVASLGHSNATLTDVLRAIDYGASHVTHFFNAMSPLNHREPGLAGAALFSTDITVEVIADGFHIHPWVLGLVVQNKGVAMTCLVTDSMSVMGFEDGIYESLGQSVRLENGRLSLADNPGTLAGSVLSMDRAVGNMMNMVGLSIVDAVMMASTAPAAVIGLHERKGRLEEGFDADITVMDRRCITQMTIVEGSIVFDKITSGETE